MIQPLTCDQMLELRAERDGAASAFRYLADDLEMVDAISYGELDRRARAIGALLQERGLKGQPVVLWYPTGFDFIAALFGVFYAGAIATPLSVSYSSRAIPRLRTTMENISPGAILTTGAILGASAPMRAAHEFLRRAAYIETDTLDLALADRLANRRRDPSETALLQYTSGSTSLPKGVQVSHANILHNAGMLRQVTGMQPDEIGMSWLPLFHDMGLIGGVFGPILARTTNVLMPSASFVRNPALWLRAVSRFGAAVSGAPNFAYELCAERLDLADLQEVDLAAWRVAFCGAEPVRASTLRRFSDKFAELGFRANALMPCYGLAEATLFVSGGPVDAGSRVLSVDKLALGEGKILESDDTRGAIQLVSSGRTHAEQEVAIVDPRRHTACGPNEVGEIWLRGPHVAGGYWSRPDETRETFGARLVGGSDAPFMRTGDLGFLRQGELTIVGRLKDLIIVRGTNHYPQDLEETASCAHQALAPGGAVAFCIERDRDAEVTIVAEVRRGKTADPAEIVEAVLRDVGEQHGLGLKAVVLVREGAIPRTSSGKVQRQLTRQQVEEGELRGHFEWAAKPRILTPALAQRSGGRLTEIWAHVLGHRDFDANSNFFEVGGDSVRLLGLQAALAHELDRNVDLATLFEHPSIASLAAWIAQSPRPRASSDLSSSLEADGPIAVVGLACRTPGARNAQAFWRNLVSGQVDIEAASSAADSDWISTRASMPGLQAFDANYFGLSDVEARWMDPQQRVMLECAVEALEDAGCDPGRASGRIGVFAASALNLAQLRRTAALADDPDVAERWLALLGTDKDYLASRVAYKLDLRGPAVAVQAACSSSLVAVHLACQGLRAGDCDVALAGGVSITQDGQIEGYRHQPGDVLSKVGRVRPFDAAADGTVFGDGVGLVVLKRLADAVRDGDHIRAVIRGSAINNDGASKLGFTAPSASGQARVITDALRRARVEPQTIGFLETHGTGTALGDPIEFQALTNAFSGAARAHPCFLGAAKANIAHLNTAAGVVGLIKAVLAVETGVIPPVAGLDQPSAYIDLSTSPFSLNREAVAWPQDGASRRAGVSAFGFGGTNAHLVLESAPPARSEGSARRCHILTLSARTPQALARSVQDLHEHLASYPDVELADVAYSLALGRRRRRFSRTLVAQDVQEALRRLAAGAVDGFEGDHGDGGRSTVFMFPGQGAQRPGMAAGLYEDSNPYRRSLDTSLETLGALGLDLRGCLMDPSAAASEQLSETEFAQPALFAHGLALAEHWMAAGVQPTALIGHSLGEYVAACVAGVVTPADALRIVVARGRAMQQSPRGAMWSVRAPAGQILARLPASLALAAVNSPSSCVLSGPLDQLAEHVSILEREGVACTRLHTSHAYHSSSMASAREGLIAAVRQSRLEPPRIPFVSNLTGCWISDAEATDPGYWAEQMMGCVRFGDGLRQMLDALPDAVLLELGPGQALCGLGVENGIGTGPAIFIPTQGPGRRSDAEKAAEALARYIAAGGDYEPERLYSGEVRRKIPLPAYSFDHTNYASRPGVHLRALTAEVAVEGQGEASTPHTRPLSTYAQTWRRDPLRPRLGRLTLGPEARVLVLADENPLNAALCARLSECGAQNLTVRTGEGFRSDGSSLEVDPRRAEDFVALLKDLEQRDWRPTHIVYLWSLSASEAPPDADEACRRSLHGLVHLSAALATTLTTSRIRLLTVTTQAENVTGSEVVAVAGALSLGVCLTLPAEIPNLECQRLDLGRADLSQTPVADLANQILVELSRPDPEASVALREGWRWRPAWEPVELSKDAPVPVRDGGVYLITGGLGGLGLAVAEALAGQARVRLALLSRRSPPPEAPESVSAALELEASGAALALQRLKALGAEVEVVQADITDASSAACAVETILSRFGAIHGLVHAAGLSAPAQAARKSSVDMDRVLAPKVHGLAILEAALAPLNLDFAVLFSSISAVVGKAGLVDYAAANAWLDAYAAQPRPRLASSVISINWDLWGETGMAIDFAVPQNQRAAKAAMLAAGISTADGQSAFLRILASGYSRVAVTREALSVGLAPQIDQLSPISATQRAARPPLSTPYVAPKSDLEIKIAAAIADVLNLERVGLDDDFFDLGGHSLLGMRLATQVRDQLGLQLDLEALFDTATPRALAAHIMATEWEEMEV